jgi:hypothetical protein
MYVDISDRGTGKTSRLVDSIVEFLKKNPDKQALVVSPTNDGRRGIKDKVHSKCGDPCSKRTVTSYRMIKTGESMNQFVDDFDHINEDEMLIEDGCYYAGSFAPEGICKEIVNTYKKTLNGVPPKMIKRHKL